MAFDPGHDETDEILAKMERKVARVYTTAQEETEQKLKEYLERLEKRKAKKLQQVADGKITQEEYDKWLNSLTGEKYYNGLLATLSTDLTNADQIAMSVVNGYMPDVYAVNMNYGTYGVENAIHINTNFSLYDRQTVERLLRDNPNLLPNPGVDVAKDLRWNKQRIRAQVTQGILQGESIPQIAKRFENVVGMDKRAAIRNARTATTGAENAGRVDSYKRAKDLGIKLKQQWIATPDPRTRYSHRILDGEIQEVGAKFSNKLEYPGDPNGDPSEVYNCRCTLVPALDMFDNDVSDLSQRFSRYDEDMDYWEWKTEHFDDVASAQIKVNYWDNMGRSVDDKTYSGIWRQPVKTSQYEQYKDRVQGKRDYYHSQLSMIDESDPRYKTIKGYLRDLDEFEEQGAKYALYHRELEQAKKGLRDAKLSGTDSGEAFSQARKDAALWFTDSNGGFRAADAYFDPPSKVVHASANAQEEHGFYRYTQGSGGHNRPLAGFRKPWSEPGSGWEEEFYVGQGKVWIDYEGRGDDIRGLTTLIQRSTYPDDLWLTSGQGYGTIEGALGLPRDSIRFMSDDELDGYAGREFVMGQFVSTSVVRGGGGCFSRADTRWNFYAPSGSQVLYASDVGAFGKSENEAILQRGGTYRITRMYWGTDADNGARTLFIDAEVHPERGYDLFQQDPSEWTGSRENCHSH